MSYGGQMTGGLPLLETGPLSLHIRARLSLALVAMRPKESHLVKPAETTMLSEALTD